MSNNNAHRPLWLSVILIAAVVAGLATSALYYVLGASPVTVVAAGGTAFAAATGLAFAAFAFLAG